MIIDQIPSAKINSDDQYLLIYDQWSLINKSWYLNVNFCMNIVMFFLYLLLNSKGFPFLYKILLFNSPQSEYGTLHFYLRIGRAIKNASGKAISCTRFGIIALASLRKIWETALSLSKPLLLFNKSLLWLYIRGKLQLDISTKSTYNYN